jgi:hypothetical protein
VLALWVWCCDEEEGNTNKIRLPLKEAALVSVSSEEAAIAVYPFTGDA